MGLLSHSLQHDAKRVPNNNCRSNKMIGIPPTIKPVTYDRLITCDFILKYIEF